MIHDARALADGAELAADLCIVGGGPAGLTLAAEFLGQSLTVILLESGSRGDDRAAQRLSDGDQEGDPYDGLGLTRHRALGGTAHLWNTAVGGGIGAKYVPLDPADFLEDPDDPLSGWPFAREALDPWYRRAQTICGLGAFRYQGEEWADAQRPFPEALRPSFTSGVYQLGPASVFTESYGRRVAGASNVAVYTGATATRLGCEGTGTRIHGLEGVTRAGRRFRLRASVFVLAAGAVENPRLLLVSRETGRHAPGDQGGWLGRCFMEHPRDTSLVLIPESAEADARLRFAERRVTADGTLIAGRLATTDAECRRLAHPKAYLTIQPIRSPGLAARAWRRITGGPRPTDPRQLLLNLEQRPHPENRITLGANRDQLGVPRPTLAWRWRDHEQAGLERLREATASAFRRIGCRVQGGRPGLRPDPNAHHHAGTTRCHPDPLRGVVDPDLRVHGIDNLYLAGTSVFPTAGVANPTLTIVALSLRLAERLATRL
jgi:choline dehydrogenase-like flavoprotein